MELLRLRQDGAVSRGLIPAPSAQWALHLDGYEVGSHCHKTFHATKSLQISRKWYVIYCIQTPFLTCQQLD